jgi:hypothetical protein
MYMPERLPLFDGIDVEALLTDKVYNGDSSAQIIYFILWNISYKILNKIWLW